MILSVHKSVCTLCVQLNTHHSMYLTRIFGLVLHSLGNGMLGIL